MNVQCHIVGQPEYYVVASIGLIQENFFDNMVVTQPLQIMDVSDIHVEPDVPVDNTLVSYPHRRGGKVVMVFPTKIHGNREEIKEALNNFIDTIINNGSIQPS